MFSNILVLTNSYALSIFSHQCETHISVLIKDCPVKCVFIVDYFSEEDILGISLCTFIILAEANGTLNRMDEQLDWNIKID